MCVKPRQSGPNPRDRELVFRIMSGEVAAFAELYRVHAGAVQAVARGYIRDHDAVADLVQDVFAHALERLGTLREPERFRAWLLSIARHAAIDHRRARAVRKFVALEEAALPQEPGPGPAEAAQRDETARLLRACCGRLSARDAAALSLVAHLGLGPAEVGAALQVKTGAAKVIVHRARRRLRTAVLVECFVRRRLRGCSELEALRMDDHDDTRAAARHLLKCGECLARANDELAVRGRPRSGRRPAAARAGAIADV